MQGMVFLRVHAGYGVLEGGVLEGPGYGVLECPGYGVL